MSEWIYIRCHTSGNPEIMTSTHTLQNERRPSLMATVLVETTPAGCSRMRVQFNAPKIWHAQAEAARFYAQLLDTIGDLDGSEPLVINPRLDMTTVELSGPDAPFPTAVYFGAAGHKVMS